MAGFPLEQLGGKTPLQVAEKPNIDWITRNGKSGRMKNIPDGMEADSDVAIMSIMGYDPRTHYSGRGPLEAAGMDIDLKENEVAFRCNLVTIDNGLIKDYSGGYISTGEAEELIDVVKENFGDIGDFHVGVDYRHLFILKNGKGAEELTYSEPHKIVGENVEDNLLRPKSKEISKILNEMMIKSKKILSKHSVNKRRINEGKNPANAIWVWGQGKTPKMKTLFEKFGVRGAVISAVTLVKGLGICAGMDKIDVPGATGYYDTNYENKAKYGLEALSYHDIVFIHVEAPDEAGHSGDLEEKIRAIENIDKRLVGKILDKLDGQYSISIMADHPTPIAVRNHVSDPVPCSIYSDRIEKDNTSTFDEFEVENGSIGTIDGFKFLDKLFSMQD